MKVLVATADSASVKEVEFTKNVDPSKQDSEAPEIRTLVEGPDGSKKPAAITHICCVGNRTACARRNGQILLEDKTVFKLSQDVVGLFAVSALKAYAQASSSEDTTDDYVLFAFAASGASVALAVQSNGAIRVSHEFTLRSGLTSVVNDDGTSIVASAGADELPEVSKLLFSDDGVQTVSVWQAEELPNNYLDLPERNLVTGMSFLGPTGLATVTSHGRIRVYNFDEGSQPCRSAQASKHGIKCITSDPAIAGTIIIGDANGTISRWSTIPLKLLGYYKGVVGSTRTISVRGPFLASGGLDRYLRVFSVEKREPMGKVYLGEEIWASAFIRHDVEDEQADIDNLWGELGSKDTKQSKRKKTGVSTNESAQSPTKSSKRSTVSNPTSKSSKRAKRSAADNDSDDFEGFDD